MRLKTLKSFSMTSGYKLYVLRLNVWNCLDGQMLESDVWFLMPLDAVTMFLHKLKHFKTAAERLNASLNIESTSSRQRLLAFHLVTWVSLCKQTHCLWNIDAPFYSLTSNPLPLQIHSSLNPFLFLSLSVCLQKFPAIFTFYPVYNLQS